VWPAGAKYGQALKFVGNEDLVVWSNRPRKKTIALRPIRCPEWVEAVHVGIRLQNLAGQDTQNAQAVFPREQDGMHMLDLWM
jgi:hypothetical protein